jgi:transposase
MVDRRRKNRLPEQVQEGLIRQFVAGVTARTAADLVGVNRDTATLYFHKLRELIALELAEREPCFQERLKSTKAIWWLPEREARTRRGW